MDGTPLPSIMQDQDSDIYFTFKADGDPKAEFVVRSIEVTETVSAPYRAEIELASRRDDIDPAALIDRPGVLTIHGRYSQPRFIHGIVMGAEYGDPGERWTLYRVLLEPSLARLRYSADSRMFQSITAPQIAEKLLKELGVDDYEFRLRQSYPQIEMLIQYDRDHLDFFDETLFENGIHYHFEHRQDGHKLILSDNSLAAADAENVPKDGLDYNAMPGGDIKGSFVRRMAWRENVGTTRSVGTDHTFRNPGWQPLQSYQAPAKARPVRDYEHYDPYVRFKAADVGNRFIQARQEHFRVLASNGHGAGRCQHLTAGRMFKLADHPNKALNQRYFLMEVSHRGEQSGALEEDAGSEQRERQGGTFYDTAFKVVAGNQPYRPPQKPKPLIEGSQLAIVTGPSGESIHCDEYGRVKIFFVWDRYVQSPLPGSVPTKGPDGNTGDRPQDQASCWVRVATSWASGQWGHVALPRVGDHVIVSFISGDINQPIITGRAYNDMKKQPYKLPDHKTKMVIRSQTHKGNGFNELSMEDESGQEEILTHAERDMRTLVKNNQFAQINQNKITQVLCNYNTTVGGSYHVKSHLGIDMKTEKSLSLFSVEGFGVGSGKSINMNSSNDFRIVSGYNFSVHSGQDISIENNESLSLKAKILTIVADEKIVIKVGNSTIKIDGSMIRVNSKKIKLN